LIIHTCYIPSISSFHTHTIRDDDSSSPHDSKPKEPATTSYAKYTTLRAIIDTNTDPKSRTSLSLSITSILTYLSPPSPPPPPSSDTLTNLNSDETSSSTTTYTTTPDVNPNGQIFITGTVWNGDLDIGKSDGLDTSGPYTILIHRDPKDMVDGEQENLNNVLDITGWKLSSTSSLKEEKFKKREETGKLCFL